MHYSPVLWFIASAVCLRLETNCRWETRSKPWPLFRRGPLRRGSADRRSGHLSAEQNYVLSFRPPTWRYPTKEKRGEKRGGIRYFRARNDGRSPVSICLTSGKNLGKDCLWSHSAYSDLKKPNILHTLFIGMFAHSPPSLSFTYTFKLC